VTFGGHPPPPAADQVIWLDSVSLFLKMEGSGKRQLRASSRSPCPPLASVCRWIVFKKKWNHTVMGVYQRQKTMEARVKKHPKKLFQK